LSFAPAISNREGHQQQGSRRGGLADADRGNIGPDVLHGVVDREPRRDEPARRVDVKGDVLLRVLGFEIEELGGDQAGDGVVERAGQEDDAVLEQPGKYVVGTLPSARLVNHYRDQIAHPTPIRLKSAA
jgi:hypothetical protein